ERLAPIMDRWERYTWARYNLEAILRTLFVVTQRDTLGNLHTTNLGQSQRLNGINRDPTATPAGQEAIMQSATFLNQLDILSHPNNRYPRWYGQYKVIKTEWARIGGKDIIVAEYEYRAGSLTLRLEALVDWTSGETTINIVNGDGSLTEAAKGIGLRPYDFPAGPAVHDAVISATKTKSVHWVNEASPSLALSADGKAIFSSKIKALRDNKDGTTDTLGTYRIETRTIGKVQSIKIFNDDATTAFYDSASDIFTTGPEIMEYAMQYIVSRLQVLQKAADFTITAGVGREVRMSPNPDVNQPNADPLSRFVISTRDASSGWSVLAHEATLTGDLRCFVNLNAVELGPGSYTFNHNFEDLDAAIRCGLTYQEFRATAIEAGDIVSAGSITGYGSIARYYIPCTIDLVSRYRDESGNYQDWVERISCTLHLGTGSLVFGGDGSVPSLQALHDQLAGLFAKTRLSAAPTFFGTGDNGVMPDYPSFRTTIGREVAIYVIIPGGSGSQVMVRVSLGSDTAEVDAYFLMDGMYCRESRSGEETISFDQLVNSLKPGGHLRAFLGTLRGLESSQANPAGPITGYSFVVSSALSGRAALGVLIDRGDGTGVQLNLMVDLVTGEVEFYTPSTKMRGYRSADPMSWTDNGLGWDDGDTRRMFLGWPIDVGRTVQDYLEWLGWDEIAPLVPPPHSPTLATLINFIAGEPAPL
nr:hypothetical protein [Candidatus Sigynarchaeota archaeon]